MFLNPILLALGVGGIAVPIIIHLLNRRQFKHVVWAAMRFIQASIEKNQRRMQVEDILLLILRCLLAALIALALARPLLNAVRILDRGQVTAAIVLDNSYSMSQTDGIKAAGAGPQNRLDQAKKIADGILEKLPGGSSAAVYLASDGVEEVIAQPTFDLNLARERVHSAALCGRGTDLFPAVQRAVRMLADKPGAKKEIYVLTDGQASGFRQQVAMQALLADQKAKIHTQFVLVGEPEVRNLGISDVHLASAMAPINQPLRVEVQVTNYSLTEVRDVAVGLQIDAERASEEGHIDAIPARAAKSVSFFVKLRTEGYHAITARLSEDHLPADDSRSMVIRGLKQTQVLIVDGNPGTEPRESQAFFLSEALHPVDPSQVAGYFMQSRVIAPADLDKVRLDEYDALVLADVPDLSTVALKRVEQYVRDGGGLMVFPGAAVNVNFYNEQLVRQRSLLPANLGEAKGDAAQGDVFVTLATRNLDHPIVAVWNQVGVGALGNPRFYRTYDLQAAKPRTGRPPPVPIGPTGTVLRYSDGRPAVVEHTWGLGRVIQFSSTANTAWNDLAVRPKVFVPLIHRCVGSLLARQDEQLNVRVGQKLVLHVPSELLGREAQITRPGEKRTLPDMRRIELVEAWPTLTFDRTDLAGVYQVTGIGANPVPFACQADPAESVVDGLSREQLDTLRSVAGVFVWKPGMATDLPVGEGLLQGTELWWYLLLGALLLAAIESFLAHRFSLSK